MKALRFSLLVLGWLSCASAVAQSQSGEPTPSPYATRFAVDGPVTAGLVGLNALGFVLIQNKKGLSEAELQTLNRADVPRFDRFAAGNYDEGARTASDALFGSAIVAAPLFLSLVPATRAHSGQLTVLYVETMGAMSAVFTLSAGSVHRLRPLAYSSAAPLDDRTSARATNSFFAGHTATTAAATFFAAKIFQDFHLDSPARPYVWAAAAALPVATAYCRVRAGRHFLSDNVVGYAVGAAVGVLVPHLHKHPELGLSLQPVQGVVPANGASYNGLALVKTL